MNGFQDAFISYGRKDSKGLVARLYQRLLAEGLDIWFDFDDIPLGVDFQQQINGGIEKSHNFLFVIAPHAVNSPYCQQEIELALRYHKRIIPLLHVEEIDRARWSKRTPNGTDADWEIYQAQGLHSSFINMHPDIAKINWVYFREGVDDFDASFQGLVDLIRRQQDYVHQHTYLLKDALTWERQQRQVTYLLDSEDAKRAHQWLTRSFEGEQPPCRPTDLQAEFITESIKRVSNGMTQVFLSYSDDDRQQRDEVQAILRGQGFTVWVNTTDIKTGTDFEQAIRDGVEKADTFVYLLSPASLASKYCQQELAFAQDYNKRIVPLLIQSVDSLDIPHGLRVLQFIDFQPNDNESRQSAIAALIQTLQDGADYYDCHKRILVQALDWERNRRRRQHLLRGKDFIEAEAWLATSRHQNAMPPTRLHEVFIQASQEVNRYFDAFISYGRVDSLEFAIQIQDRLSQQGLDVWLDKNDIPVGVDFQTQINDGISRAHNFIFIISPHSAYSPYCLREIQLALQFNKRIIPLMHVEELSYGTWRQRNPEGTLDQWRAYQAEGRHLSKTHLHPEIRKLNWLFFREGLDEPDAAIANLIDTLRQHEQGIHLHTELLLKALVWDDRQRSASHLLTGDDRREAEAWLTAEFAGEQPPYRPTDLQCAFITTSIKQVDGTTQVFLCAADEYPDLDVTDGRETGQQRPSTQIRRVLERAGITVWNPQTDVNAGENLKQAIARGVEETDTIVFLMTPHALKTTLCLEILNQGLQFNKRIIPVLLQTLDSAKLPSILKSLRPIKLECSSYDVTVSTAQELIGALRQDAVYYRTHKLLLRKALKWERQKSNPSILLRGTELRRYATWLEVAQSHQHPPTVLQQRFIEDSLRQPPDQTVDVFLVYAPEDVEFARKLNQTLQVQSKTTWFEQEHHATEIHAQEDIQHAIATAENVVVVLSPSSADSQTCLKQLEHAVSLNKRIIPVIYQEVLVTKLPPAIDRYTAIDFRAYSGDFLTNFGKLYRAIESEPEHMGRHTRLLVKAKEWEDAHRDDSYLLLGRERNEAIAWLAQAQEKSPPPTALHREYIQASKQLPFRRIKQRSVVITGLAATLIAGGLRIFGGLQALELQAFDQLLRLRPPEAQDNRLLTVSVDQSTGSWLRERLINGDYEPGLGTVPDRALAEAIAALDAQGAELIGVDLYRDFPAAPELLEQLQRLDNVIGICEASDGVDEGVNAPAELPMERVGFNDFLNDGGNVVRRHYLKHEADPDFCNTEDSFSLVLARRYLAQHGIDYIDPWQDGYLTDLQFGDTAIPELYDGHSGGYPLHWARARTDPWVSGLGGYQTMINFRTPVEGAPSFAPVVSLKDLLTGEVPQELIEGRVVLIGYDDLSDRNADYFDTAYGDMPGVVLQGQMTSQLIHAALEKRPLIWWVALEYDLLWIGGWSILGGMVFWGLVRPLRLASASAIALGLLYGTCYAALAGAGLWLPLVPAALAYLVAGAGVAALSYRVRHPT